MNKICLLLFPIITLVMYKKMGIKRSNKALKKVIFQISVILILLYVILSNLSGLYFGFVKNPILVTPQSILKNTYSIIIVIICMEYIRYMIAKRSYKGLVIITVLFIILEIIYIKTFNFISLTTLILPSIGRNIICSYICYYISPYPGMLFRIFFGIYPFVFLIFPNYGNYITSIIDIILPYLLFVFTRRYINHYEKTKKTYTLKKNIWYLNVPLSMLLIVLFILTTGLFKYQLMAIGSGSMEPIINYGDAVIFEKMNSLINLKKDDIIVFSYNNTFVVHRIYDIDYVYDDVVIKTKGDANSDVDSFNLNKSDVVGIVRTNIRFIGIPTILIRELF